MKAAPAALELAERAVRAARADEADAVAHRERSGFARFADSRVHQPTLVENASVTLRVVRDGRIGTVATNRVDDEGLDDAARRAERAADAARIDRAFPGLPRPSAVPEVESHDDATAALTPRDQAERAWAAIAAAPRHRLFGYFTSGVTELAVASTTGMAVSQSLTDATLVALAAAEGESGYAEACAWRVGDINAVALAEKAAAKAERTRDARAIEPGTYRAVLEPYAVAELVSFFGFAALGSLAFTEGRSYLSGRIGERIFDERVTIVDDAVHPSGLPKAFDFEGVPKQTVGLIERGVARDVVWDRRTARAAGRESTGHALAPPSQQHGAIPFNLAVEAGSASSDDLVAAVGDGIYVTRLHYVNVVDERDAIFTGMTRDGTFLVENGRMTRPLVNLRFTTSFPELAATLLAVGAGRTLVNQSDFYGERYPYGSVVPGLATARFSVVGTGSSPGL